MDNHKQSKTVTEVAKISKGKKFRFNKKRLILIITGIGLILLTGCIVYNIQHRHSDAKKSPIQETLENSTDPPLTFTLPKQPLVFTFDQAKFPAGWQVFVNDPNAIIAGNGRDCSLSLTQTIDKSLQASDSQSFIEEKLADMEKANAKTTDGSTFTLDQPTKTLILTDKGQQTITAYPQVEKNGTGQTVDYSKFAYVVKDGYYLMIKEQCSSEASLATPDQALLNITIKGLGQVKTVQ